MEPWEKRPLDGDPGRGVDLRPTRQGLDRLNLGARCPDGDRLNAEQARDGLQETDSRLTPQGHHHRLAHGSNGTGRAFLAGQDLLPGCRHGPAPRDEGQDFRFRKRWV
jgi:hypothetical protein